MTRPLSVCVVSGGRADYGLLVPVLRLLRGDPRFRLQLVLTGQHLALGVKGTAARVRGDGFDVAAEIDMAIGRDDSASIIRSVARALDGMADVFVRLKPDIVLVLGDRYEIMAAALAATIARLPIAHIAGGDVTEGAFDDAFRHSISKMAHVHFPTNANSAQRLRQLGEENERIHVTGSPGIDLIRITPVLSRDAFFEAVGISPRAANLVVSFHPETLAADTLADLNELLAALSSLGPDIAILFTGSNADPNARQIDERIEAFAAGHPMARVVDTLGAERYFSALTHMDVIVGNSSSGLLEAPSFGIPTVDIGNRQKGRLRADSVINCRAARAAILEAIETALARGRRPSVNPYGDGHAAERVVEVLAGLPDPRALLIKRFVDVKAA
ncbi:MAG: UDP-N-acetylglucosamine 2-epimerase (hydrolyzing) [Alphaproteobacteria bacterium]|nr:UDP-N-acetylglucosamine 2-epimerase (hydrolyzing) [Alphaproteobacteria bacterium]